MNPNYRRVAARQAFFSCLTFGAMLGPALQATAALRYQAVLLGGNCAGGPAHNDNLSRSAVALAQNLDRWKKWDFGVSLGNIDRLCISNGARKCLCGKQ